MTALLENPALLNGLIRAVLLVAIEFGVQITQPQMDAVLTLVTAALLVIGSLALTARTLAVTTPVAAPVLPEGTFVEVVTPEGRPNHSVAVL